MIHKSISNHLWFTTYLFVAAFFMFLLASVPMSEAATDPPIPHPDHLRYKPLSFTPPKVEQITLENGLRVFILPDRELPLVEVKAVVCAGSAYDPPGMEGLAELTAAAMRTGGVAGTSGNAIDEALDFMAAVLGVSTNRDYGMFDFSVLKKDLEQGFDLFAKILMSPTFEQEKIIRAKDLKIEELRRIADDPQKLAFREFGKIMHEGSPRGRVATQNSVRRIQKEDILRFHEHFFHPRNILISITGDLQTHEAKNLIARHLGAWSSFEAIPAPIAPPTPRVGNIFFLAKNVPQSIVLLGWLAPGKHDPCFYPFTILDFIAGSGGLHSRIFQEIRTNLGLAYSTGSFYEAKADYGLFGAYAMTKSESTVKVVTTILGMIREMAEKNVAPEELDRAKQAILNSFIFSFTSAEQVALQSLMIEFNGLPDDFLNNYRSKIGNVSVGNIRDAAARYVRPDGEIILIIGNEEVYQDILRTFNKVVRINEALF